jgi:hypothetical protein
LDKERETEWLKITGNATGIVANIFEKSPTKRNRKFLLRFGLYGGKTRFATGGFGHETIFK